ncbi:hypothetical protein [Paraflavitalea speifideaquila]|uniref:hypothetical protein n=1 Tax=Paraflavitalea speifideaquila TaxID=3076558 RepID=UPI0028E5EF32|nr:hypothetical protein [Paraflavitalea speifideiaquila]
MSAESESRLSGSDFGENTTFSTKLTAPGVARVFKQTPDGKPISSSTQVNLINIKAAAYIGFEISLSINLPDLGYITPERNGNVSESTQVYRWVTDPVIKK